MVVPISIDNRDWKFEFVPAQTLLVKVRVYRIRHLYMTKLVSPCLLLDSYPWWQPLQCWHSLFRANNLPLMLHCGWLGDKTYWSIKSCFLSSCTLAVSLCHIACYLYQDFIYLMKIGPKGSIQILGEKVPPVKTSQSWGPGWCDLQIRILQTLCFRLI